MAEHASSPVISAENLTKTYGETTAVDAISFEVTPGESFGLLGPNGAGKSSTMRMIGAVSHRTSGELAFWGLTPTIMAQLSGSSWGLFPNRTTLTMSFGSETTSLCMAATLVCRLKILLPALTSF
jgi:lipooligosaccharide transport system ATP-binding protein